MVALVTLDRVKQALRIDHSDDDDLLSGLYIPAASGAVIDHLKGQADVVIGLEEGELPEDAEVPEAVQTAVILLVRYWYDPSDLRQDFADSELPVAVKAILKPLRDPALA